MEDPPRWIVPTPHGALELARPWVMGVLTVALSSASSGEQLDEALTRARTVLDEGASIVDLCLPEPAPAAVEQERLIPVVSALSSKGYPLPISVETPHATVARAAVEAGASLINDPSGLADSGMLDVVSELDVPVIISHTRRANSTSVVDEVFAYLRLRRERALNRGIPPEQILLDPGIGFGKTLEQNLDLLVSLPDLAELAPVLVGVSRSRLIGPLLRGRPLDQRTCGGVGGAVSAALAGASIIRVHDVRENVDALQVAWAIEQRRAGKEANGPCGAP